MDGCIETTSYRDRGGYGDVWRSGRRYKAHRWAWIEANGPIPDGLFVLHHCDNPPCVNVEHLFLGTAADNAHDRDDKGRGRIAPHPVRGDRNGSRTHPESRPRGDRHGFVLHPEARPRGSRQGSSKLTEADIPVIRTRVAAGESLITVAESYGVTRTNIGYIVRRRSWRHVP